MASGGLASHGTLLKVGDGAATEAFTTLAEVLDIRGPKLKQSTKEVTSHDSTNHFDEHVGTILRGGEVTFSINYIPTNATHDQTTGILKDMTDRTLRNFQLVFPDTGATQWEFAALITEFGPGAPVDGVLTSDLSLLISGSPTLA